MYQVIPIIVASIGPLVAFWLAGLNTRSLRKIDVARVQFDSFYLPFLKLYIQNMMWEIRLSELSEEARGEFMRLIIDNLHFSSFLLQRLIPELYVTHLEVLRLNEGNLKYSTSLEHIDKLFLDFVQVAFLDYEELTQKLKLPPPYLPPSPVPLPNDTQASKPRV